MILACLLALSASPLGGEGLRFDVAAKPYVDLYFHVRTLASSKDPPAELGTLAPAVEAARALEAQLGGILEWGVIDGLLGECATAKQGSAALADVPESVTLRSGKQVELRAGTLKLAQALEAAEPAFLEQLWPEHKRAVDAAAASLQKDYGGKEGECLAYVAKSLALAPGPRAIPVRLVYQVPFPGAVTQISSEHAGVCFVGVHDLAGTQLCEIVLHESTHALDVATAAPKDGEAGSVLDELRARLEKAGLTRKDREWRDVPHTLMFVQAGETIRRLVDGKHEHVGVVSHYYDKVRAVADLELPAWKDYLDGKATRAEALDRIVAGVQAARKPR
jgi:hypothetical protein